MPNTSLSEQLPFVLTLLALIIWFSFQLTQNLKTRETLLEAAEKQDIQLQNSNKVRQSLSALALATKQLASQGNANADLVVKNLAARGIKIDPSGDKPADATADKK